MSITYFNCTGCLELSKEIRRLKKKGKFMRDISYGIAIASIWAACAFSVTITRDDGVFIAAVIGTLFLAISWSSSKCLKTEIHKNRENKKEKDPFRRESVEM